MSNENVLVNISKRLLIKPGDTVELVWGDASHEYKVKDAGNGRLAVKYRFWRNSWTDWEGTQAEAHEMWRKVLASPAVQFVEIFAQKTAIKSRQKLNGFFYKAIEMAVEGGLKFNEDDFFHLAKKYASFSRDYDYATTVQSGNKSAIKALEKYMGHKPYWYKTLDEKPRRLYVGATFIWEGLRVNVTSFKPDYMIACHQVYEERITKTRNIFRITREELEYRYQQRIKLTALGEYLGITHPAPERKEGYQQESGGEVWCEDCATGWPGKKHLDYSFLYIRNAAFAT